MVKQSPSRNHRSRGFKVKHILQICILLAVCFWLIYQVKHSRDKKKAFDESEANFSLKDHIHDEVIKFGRKDLHPERIVRNGKPDEEEAEDDETGAGEEDKHEEEEQDEDTKTEEKEDEGRGGGDDEIDEHDQDKSELENDREEDFLDDEKEREIDEKEAEEKDAEDKEGQNEQESSLEDQDHEGVSRNAHEAREEHYKADDASSAVTHESEVTSTETQIATSENSDENNEMNILQEDNKLNKTEEILVSQNNTSLDAGEGAMTKTGTLPNVVAKGQEVHEIVSSVAEVTNSTITTESKNEPEVLGTSSTTGNTEIDNVLLQNGTETELGLTEAQNVKVGNTTSEGSILQDISLGQDNSSLAVSNKEQSDSNPVISHNTTNEEAAMGEFSNSSNAAELSRPESESVEVEGRSGSTAKEIANVTQNENVDNSDSRDGTDESVDSSAENGEEVHHDPIDSADSGIILEKDVRTDLDTLPDIRTEGISSEDAAAE